MSIKIMSRVWERSGTGGSQLLLLLAIADNANDSGVAWPGQKYLADKIRMVKRSIPRLAAKLNKSGELFINDQSSTGHVTRYIVTTGMDEKQFLDALRIHLRFNVDEIGKASKWFAQNRGDDNLSTPENRGDDIAVSGGDDIAVSSEEE